MASSGVSSGAGLLEDFAFATRTAGDLATSSTTYVDVDTGIDLVLNAAAGDTVLVGIAGKYASQDVIAFMDCVTVVAGSPVTYLSGTGSTGNGVQAWMAPTGTGGLYQNRIGGAIMYTLVSGDVSAGTIRLRLRWRVNTATSKTLLASSTSRFHWWAMNLGVAPT